MRNQFKGTSKLSDYIGNTSQVGGTQKLIVDEGNGKASR